MDDFSELEAELKELRPAPASTDLVKRVEASFAATPAGTPAAGVLPRRKLRVNWFALGLGTVAAAVFLLLARVGVDRPEEQRQSFASVPPAPSTESNRASGLVPDGVTRVVYNTRDEGLIFTGREDEPVRRRRSRSRETLKWTDPGTGASLRVSYPTEEVEIIPVSGQ